MSSGLTRNSSRSSHRGSYSGLRYALLTGVLLEPLEMFKGSLLKIIICRNLVFLCSLAPQVADMGTIQAVCQVIHESLQESTPMRLHIGRDRYIDRWRVFGNSDLSTEIVFHEPLVGG